MSDSRISSISLSVLLPVYAGVRPEYLQRCLESVYDQTYPATEVVVVEDGPLTEELETVLAGFEGRSPVLRRIALAVNGGAGISNGAGLLAASCEWIAKMDADDIALPHRFETQVRALSAGTCDVLGSAMAEFVGDESHVVAIRTAPRTHAEIARRMRMNNPVNHPTAMYRRDLALAVGGYPKLRFMQDYDLFARMLAAGARMENLSEPLVLFRADHEMHRRRKSSLLTRCELELQRDLQTYGIITRRRRYLNLVLRLTYRRLPPRLLRAAYSLLFTRKEGR